LPGSEDLPDSDDTPVDNEGQNTIPNGLLLALAQIWHDRQDWFFGVDMGVYDRTGQKQRAPTIVPDGFLALGVTRRKGKYGRSSYVIAEENDVIPILALEYLSKSYGSEYDRKVQIYAQLGVKYYVVYNPQRQRKHKPIEFYCLVDGQYQLQPNNEWMWFTEIGLGMGLVQGILSGTETEWLTWFDAAGQPYPLPEQVIENLTAKLRRQQGRIAKLKILAEQERSKAKQERSARLKLLDRLRQMGIDLSDLEH